MSRSLLGAELGITNYCTSGIGPVLGAELANTDYHLSVTGPVQFLTVRSLFESKQLSYDLTKQPKRFRDHKRLNITQKT